MNELPEHEVAIFNAARRLAGEECAAYLDQACAGDAALRRRLDELLRVDEGAGAFLEKPALADPNALAMPGETLPPALQLSEKPGDRIGPYKLLQQIGEGGCGVVYMAEQEAPIRRRVALKVIKLGMDTKQVIARFEAERQALALMDHPNIARVLDAGATETGRPYFVMELVRGTKITDYCDQQNLSTRARLDLFIKVCQAIQHAHQKGVIHRDIKPSNILVTINDGVAVPKVIDFGIAKATQGRLTDLTLFTAFEQFIGTPAYMSPEQAVLTSLDVDTRSDIYSLGVLLYELLTGQTPFDSKELLAKGLDEMRRTIREQEPRRPSNRLTTMEEGALTTTAQRRQTDPPKLVHLVRGDLDWIVMKCLEKDRSRRYETANGLVFDLRRHLNNEPVLARPPSNWYRLQKMARRNKLAFAAASAVAVSLVISLIIAISSLIRVQHAHLQTQMAKNDAVEKLWASYVAEAWARRAGNLAGRRFGSLEALTNAAAIHPNLTVRNEAIAALALSDMRVVRLADFKWNGSDEGLRFDFSAERYAAAEPDGSITLHAASSDRTIATLPSTGGAVRSVSFSPDGRFVKALYSGQQGGNMWVWDADRMEPVLKNLPGDWAGDFSGDSRQFAWSNPEGSASVYDLGTGREIKRIGTHATFNWLRFDRGKKLLACSRGGDPIIQVYAIASGERILTVTNPAPVNCAASWDPGGNFLVSGSVDFNIYLFDAHTGQQLRRLSGHIGRVTDAVFNHAGDVLASSSWDDTLRLWNPATGEQIVSMVGGARGFDFSADDRHLGAILEGPRFGIAEVAISKEYRVLRTKPVGPAIFRPAFSPDGRLVATGTGERVCFWDVASGSEVGSFPTGHCDTLIFLPDGSAFITTEKSGGVYLRTLRKSADARGVTFTLGKPRQISNLPGPREADLSSDGRHLAVPSFDTGQILVMDLKDAKANIVLSKHDKVDYAAISLDGRWAASGSWQNQWLKIWDANSGDLVKTLQMPTRSRPKFSPDGRWLAIIGQEYQILEVGSWTTNGPPLPGSNWMHFNDLAFSPDGTFMAIVQSGHLIKLLEISSRRQLATLEAPDQTIVRGISFCPDGTRLAAAGDDQQLRLWDLRLIRQELKSMNLDWDLPPYPPVQDTPLQTITLQVEQ